MNVLSIDVTASSKKIILLQQINEAQAKLIDDCDDGLGINDCSVFFQQAWVID